MVEEFNIVLEQLRFIRGELAELKEGQRLTNRRLSSLERHMAADRYDVSLQREELDEVKNRLERIERRLDLHDPQH